MAIEFNREAYTKVSQRFGSSSRLLSFEGKVFNEKALYNKEDQLEVPI